MEYLGRDELSPSWTPSWNPTIFDTVTGAMVDSITSRLSFDLINPKAWKYVGLMGGPVQKFLTHYIQVAAELKRPYDKSDFNQWATIFKNRFGYTDTEQLELYFSTLRQLRESGRVPDELWEPYNYTVEVTGLLPQTGKTILKYVVIGGVAYALIVYGAPALLKTIPKRRAKAA